MSLCLFSLQIFLSGPCLFILGDKGNKRLDMYVIFLSVNTRILDVCECILFVFHQTLLLYIWGTMLDGASGSAPSQ